MYSDVLLYLFCVLEVVWMWSVSCLLQCCICLRGNDVCEDGVCSVYVWWWLNVRESSLGVCSELCPVCFPIVRECVSVCCSLYLVRVLIVVIMGR